MVCTNASLRSVDVVRSVTRSNGHTVVLLDGSYDVLAERSTRCQLMPTPAANAQLDTLIQVIQAHTARYGGTLLQITIGDKGSYLYVVFGAPIAHEDDPRCAAHAALERRTTTR